MPYLQAPGVNAPFGFQPVEGPVPAQTHVYYVGTSAASHPSGNGTFAVLPGDVVLLSTDNTLWVATSGGISLSGTGARAIVGIAAQAVLQSNASQTPCLVYDDPNQVFVVQDDGTATAGMGSSNNEAWGAMLQFNATATGGNSASTGNVARSGMTLKSSSGGGGLGVSRVLAASATTQLPIQVLAIHPIEYTPNAPASTIVPTASGQWRKWLVKFNAHAFAVRQG